MDMKESFDEKRAERVKEFIRGVNQKEIFEAIQIERMVQDDKWGKDRNLSGFEWLVILMEEVGESAEQVLESNDELLKNELIQVAAVAVAYLERLEMKAHEKELSDK